MATQRRKPKQRSDSSAPPAAIQEIDPATQMADAFDRVVQGLAAHATVGLSVPGILLAFSDWWMHLATSPGKQLALVQKATRKGVRYASYLSQAVGGEPCPDCIEPLAQDSRFDASGWHRWPFNALQQGFLHCQQWCYNATTDIRGVTPHHEAAVCFLMRQMLDLWSPSNFPWLNPEVLEATRAEGGQNFVRGLGYFVEDFQRGLLGAPPPGAESFLPGKAVACTPGKVVFRNRLIELIQYTPTTESVYGDPVLFIPAWIMRYYILDLSPQNSLVRYLVERGHTVFMISWRNPGPQDSDLSMDDYLRLGALEALAAVRSIVPDRRVHAAGYCLGGTLVAMAAAALAGGHEAPSPFASLTLFAAQVDFEEPGELGLFIDDSEVSLLEAMMSTQGFLDAHQMAGAFQLLRSNDLIWSRRVNEYLLGRRAPMSDLMAWNADGTRMPARMHSEYLRKLFLRNDLSAGRYKFDGRTLALSDLRTPIFAVGTERDHVAPWRSIFKVNLYSDAEVTFVLASGGHNVGIVNPPGASGHYRLAFRKEDEAYVDPDAWLLGAELRPGSWWPEWQTWLAQRSGPRVPVPPMGRSPRYPALGDAPGSYVLQK